MAKRTGKEILDAVAALLGDNTSDEALALVEDISDTFTSYEGRDDMDWESRYNELDKSWRQRYRDRFMKGEEPDSDESHEEPDGDENKPLTYENLFKEE